MKYEEQNVGDSVKKKKSLMSEKAFLVPSEIVKYSVEGRGLTAADSGSTTRMLLMPR